MTMSMTQAAADSSLRQQADSQLPKAELHCHLEGAIPPDLAQRFAARNGQTLPAGLITEDGQGYRHSSFLDFLAGFDQVSATLSQAQDYIDLVEHYLLQAAREGVRYVEFFISPEHAAAKNISYSELLEALSQGIDQAQAAGGAVCRLIVTCVRHLGPERALAVAEQMVQSPHPYVVGFGMGGDELKGSCRDFRPAFDLADKAGIATTVHAGEVGGPDSVRDALDNLPVSRLGHGVRSAEDPALLKELAQKDIHLEVCPTSNLALKIYDSLPDHPLPRLLDAGCRLSLNSDDPPFFQSSVAGEYAQAQREFGLTDSQLLQVTRWALEDSFAPQEIKESLLQDLTDWSEQRESC
ncbi:adenosine deaminase [Rhodovibrionaceae bacterium A322]